MAENNKEKIIEGSIILLIILGLIGAGFYFYNYNVKIEVGSIDNAIEVKHIDSKYFKGDLSCFQDDIEYSQDYLETYCDYVNGTLWPYRYMIDQTIEAFKEAKQMLQG